MLDGRIERGVTTRYSAAARLLVAAALWRLEA